jgi:hypothetical protein
MSKPKLELRVLTEKERSRSLCRGCWYYDEAQTAPCPNKPGAFDDYGYATPMCDDPPSIWVADDE